MRAVLIGTQMSIWTLGSICCLLICALCLPTARASEFDISKQPVYRCPPGPDSPDPEQHEKFLNGLNGTRIVLIGDSITRFQYVTLASYLAKGVCPGKDTDSRSKEYTSLYIPRGVWDDYYRESSNALNTELSVETCFCEETKTMPEYRAFTYKDEQGRVIEVIYMFYEYEFVKPLRDYVQKASNMDATHIVLNYGHWMAGSSRECGYEPPFSHCPNVTEVCEFLNGEHPFKVIWQTTSPKRDVGDTIVENHLHIPHECHLDRSKVLHRGLILYALESDRKKQDWLYHDPLHLSPFAYHAFNGVLMQMISTGKTPWTETTSGKIAAA